MKIAIGSDHRGAEVRAHLKQLLHEGGHEVTEFDGNEVRVHGKHCDYPDIAYPLGLAVAGGEVDRGILICGSGIGMSIAANKIDGVRAALVHDDIGAAMSRRHNNANILCLAADLLGMRMIDRLVEQWLTTPFEGGRHGRRVAKITAIEQGRNPGEVTDKDATSSASES